MSTVVEDLLNDFGSSGDEAEDGENNGLLRDDADEERDANAMEVDGEREDESPAANQIQNVEDADAAKIKVEKMQLSGVKDVRSVASLMQTLEPILEVSTSPVPDANPFYLGDSFTSIFPRTRPDVYLERCRKSPITDHKPRHRLRLWGTSRTTQSTIC